MKSKSRAAAWLTLLLCVAWLAGCTTLPRNEPSAEPFWAGRLSVQVAADGATPARALSAAFELHGNPSSGHLDLSTPLGSMLAQARWSPTQVVLVTPRGQTDYADLDALTREVLGESLPVAALFDWLRGRPWPGAPSTPGSTPPGFEQLGWTVSLAHLDEALLRAHRTRPPAVTLQIKLDRS